MMRGDQHPCSRRRRWRRGTQTVIGITAVMAVVAIRTAPPSPPRPLRPLDDARRFLLAGRRLETRRYHVHDGVGRQKVRHQTLIVRTTPTTTRQRRLAAAEFQRLRGRHVEGRPDGVLQLRHRVVPIQPRLSKRRLRMRGTAATAVSQVNHAEIGRGVIIIIITGGGRDRRGTHQMTGGRGGRRRKARAAAAERRKRGGFGCGGAHFGERRIY